MRISTSQIFDSSVESMNNSLSKAVNFQQQISTGQQYSKASDNPYAVSWGVRLSFDKPIMRIECFDISHTMGQQIVASCVVFDESGANQKAYRRFNIEGITPGDDYAAMRQVLLRRFKRLRDEAVPFPDVVLIDGGKGQLSEAIAVLNELDIQGVQLIGVDSGAFWSQMQGGVDVIKDIGNGVIKSVVFGIAVTFIALYQGFESKATPEGVSLATTRTVVISSLTVLALDFLLTAVMFST